MRRGLLALLVLTSCSCGGSTSLVVESPSSTATASASTTTKPTQPASVPVGPYAIVVGPGNGAVSLVSNRGRVIATSEVSPTMFRPQQLMSWTSASQTRLYFLSAGSEVRFLRPDAATGMATTIKLGASEQAGFAVSPDDARIAVAILSYTPAPAGSPLPGYNGMRLYVEDLQGGGHHLDIFSSPTVA